MIPRQWLVPAAVLALLAGPSNAQSLQGEALIRALRQGGHVIVMRHASSPREAPDPKTSNPDNVNRERQLDETGRATATEMGKALHELKIPIGIVLTSPTYRSSGNDKAGAIRCAADRRRTR
jgi:hypothetical protein